MKGKKSTTLFLVMLLSLSIPSVFSSNDAFTVEYSFDSLTITDCGKWIEGTILQEIPGEPLIPYYPASILLPQDATVKDVKVKTNPPVIQKGIDIPWGQPPCSFESTPAPVEKNEAIYSSDNTYPGTLFEVVSVESFRGFQILNVHLFPVQYKPKSHTVKFYQTITVEVKFGKGLKNKLYRGLQEDISTVTTMVDNPDMAETYGDGGIILPTEEYIIITNDTLKPEFQKLADWKANFVNGYGVYTVSWIYSNYTGVDNQEKIRNFISDWYTNHDTSYVLLGGDIAVIPHRMFNVSGTNLAADMYYAHLDGDFDADGDGIYGETTDNVDWYAEVAVGRAPCETITEASHFVNKVITYEKATKPYRVLFHQSRAVSGNNPDSRCLGWNCDDWVPYYYVKDYLFEEDQTVTKTLWRQHWGYNPAAVVHMGHGSASSYYINYEVGGNVTWYNSDIASLTNTFWPWHTTVACHTGEFTYNDCIAEEYVKADNGAIACIHNYSSGWFSWSNACKYSGEFCEMEFRACFTDGYENLGDILNQARSYLVSSAQSNSTYRWCFYERNLFGDPESPSFTRRSEVCGQQVGNGWNFTDYLVGNWTGDGTDDLIVRKSNGEMWLYPFRDNTFYGHHAKKVADNYNYTHYLVGDWTTDGTDDLICRDSNGYMWLCQFDNETFLSPVLVGHGWNFTDYLVGNWTGDGTADLIVRKSNGEMWLYPFRDNSFHVPGYGKKVAENWFYTHYFPGYWTGDGTDDMIVRDSGAYMYLYPFRSEKFCPWLE
jgi:hypothetical protein